jgi:hypothetical protein
MKLPRKNRQIASLTGPRGMKQFRAYGVRLTEGTTVRAKVEESGLEEKLLSLVFVKNGCRERAVLANDNLNLALLPRATVSFRTLARAAMCNSREISLFNLGALAFETLFETHAKIKIELGVRVRSKARMVRFSIKIGKYSSSAACPLTELKSFVEQHNSNADSERDGEEQ